jgi:hypothetical protein
LVGDMLWLEPRIAEVSKNVEPKTAEREGLIYI